MNKRSNKKMSERNSERNKEGFYNQTVIQIPKCQEKDEEQAFCWSFCCIFKNSPQSVFKVCFPSGTKKLFLTFIFMGLFFQSFICSSVYSAQLKSARADSELTFSISAHDLNRIKVVNDRIRNIKMNDGELEIIEEHDFGEIYIRPAQFNPESTQVIFITTDRGYTYKLTLNSKKIPAEQLFIQNADFKLDKMGEREKAKETKETKEMKKMKEMKKTEKIEKFEEEGREQERKKERKEEWKKGGEKEGNIGVREMKEIKENYIFSFPLIKQGKIQESDSYQDSYQKKLKALLELFRMGKRPLGYEYNTISAYLNLGPFKLIRTRCFEDSNSNLILERYCLKNPFNKEYELNEHELFFNGVKAIYLQKRKLKPGEKIFIYLVRAGFEQDTNRMREGFLDEH